MRPISQPLRAAALAVPILLAGLTATGCSNGPDTAAEASKAAPTTAVPVDPADGDDPEALVEALAIDDADLAAGEERAIVAEGQPQAEEEPATLRYCSAWLVNEGARVQRMQVQLADEDGVHATIDVALYSPGRAMAALREVGASELDCPDGLVSLQRWEAATGPASWSSEQLPDALLGDLTEERWARTITRTPAGDEPEVTTVIAQRRGDVLIVVTSPDQERAILLAESAHARLAAAGSRLIDG